MKALVINGPNLNMLGIREPGIYGSDNYDRLVQICQEAGAAQGFDEVEVFQSNHEGSIVDKIQEAYGKVDYARLACFATITGEGLQGYAHALELLKEYLLH